MNTRRERQREALEDIKSILRGEDGEIGIILVEGPRDAEALRILGSSVKVEVSSRVGQTEPDVANGLAEKTRSVLVLTDFDEEGRKQAARLSELLEAEGVRVRRELRRKMGRLMGILGVKTVESLDDAAEEVSE
ncbi:MAG: toprim domain-containing protein [Candidatus Bathyarchaeia archaeon]